MRHKGDSLLPVPCSKTTALRLIDNALTKRSLDSGRQIAEECLRRGYPLKRTETMLICIMIFATSESRYSTTDRHARSPFDDLWDEAITNLPQRHYSEAAGLLIRLADIYMEQDQIERAWTTLLAAEQYVISDASRLQYNAVCEVYEELNREPRIGTVIDFRA